MAIKRRDRDTDGPSDMPMEEESISRGHEVFLQAFESK